jgi:Spy/CpxP family protein refolding chaperone
MKINFVILLLLGAISVSAQIERKPVVVQQDSAQTTAGDTRVDKQSRKDRFKELDLTLEQKGKMKEIIQANKAAKEAIENNAQISEQEKKKQLHELQRSKMMKVQVVLTPEQREKFKASLQNNP